MVLRKLALANLTSHRARVALTIAAIALSISLVVAVTSGYASVEAAAYRFLSQYMGSVDATLTRQNDLRGGVSERIIDELKKDPQVRRVTGRLELNNGLLDESSGEAEPSRMAGIVGVKRPDDTQVEALRMTSGTWFNTDDGDVAVIDQAVSEQLKINVGDTLTLPGLDKQLKLKVVGIVHKPAIMAEHLPTVYVPLRTMQRFTDYRGLVTSIKVEFNRGTDPQAFAARWVPRLKELDPTLKLRLAGQQREKLAKNLVAIHLLSYMGGMVSMVAAAFIVFSALSMGVTERQRTLAMLRAVGAFRSQVALLVVLEGVLLAVGGIIVGVPLGWSWVHILAWKFSKVFIAGVVISRGGILFGAAGSVLAALAASLLPAWSAARVSPLEAMSPQAAVPSSRLPWISAAAGLILASFDPFLLLGPLDRMLATVAPLSPEQSLRVKFDLHFAVGVPGLMLGFFLLAPLFVRVIELLFGPPLALLTRLQLPLLRQQISTGVWRAAGTGAALMVGLATLIVLQVQGNTALSGWKLPDKFPDIFIAKPFGGVKIEEAKKLEEVPGIKRDEVMPIAIASPGLSSGFFGIAQAMIMPDATMFFGIDPDRAFRLMELDFRDGNAEQAKRMLKLGHHIIVTNEFKELKGLGVGSKMTLETIHGPQEYTVAGVVWSPGIDVIVSTFDMGRQMDQRTAASVFGTLEDAARDFGVNRYYLFAANLDYFVEKEQVLKDVQHALKLQGMRAGDVREIKFHIQQGLRNMLLLVSTVAFAAMAVASLGVTNTIMASIRTRRWQFGVLRSIGVTRSQLLRLVLAEAALIGLVGCGLGLTAGLLMSVDAHALSVLITGYNPPLSIPWGIVGVGLSIVMAVAIAASIWPAASVAHTEPLALLQAGRAAA